MTAGIQAEKPCPEEFVALAGRLADAARGVVLRYFRETLSVDRKADETPVVAAAREVREETGLEVTVPVDVPAASIDYWFVAADGEKVHKRVEFFRMEAVGGDPADHDDEVEEVALLDPQEARQRLTYENERAVLDQALV